MVRAVNVNVSGKPKGTAQTWAYPKGSALGLFTIPTYTMSVRGTTSGGTAKSVDFEVLRFGVQCNDGRTTRVVGLADSQTHVIKQWIPTYRVHSARSPENGGWQVYGNFLIHDGPDDANEVFASIGCVEVMGSKGFIAFNDLLLELSGAQGSTRDAALEAIAKSRKFSIHYDRAVRPALKAS